MSTVEPTDKGKAQPKRNKETTRSTTDCLQWAIVEGIGLAGCQEMHCFVFRFGCCHLCSFLENWVPTTNGLKHAAACRSMPQHAAARQIFLGDRWCLLALESLD